MNPSRLVFQKSVAPPWPRQTDWASRKWKPRRSASSAIERLSANVGGAGGALGERIHPLFVTGRKMPSSSAIALTSVSGTPAVSGGGWGGSISVVCRSREELLTAGWPVAAVQDGDSKEAPAIPVRRTMRSGAGRRLRPP